MKKTFLISALSLMILFSSGAIVVHAQLPTGSDSNPAPTGSDSNPSGPLLPNPFKGGTSLFDLLKSVIQDILIPIGAVLSVIGFIYAGFKYVMARGDAKKIEEAHRTLLYVAIGSAVLLGAWTLSQVIQNTISKLM